MNIYGLDVEKNFDFNRNLNYLHSHKNSEFSRTNNILSISYKKEHNLPSSGFRIKLQTKIGQEYLLFSEALLIHGDKAFIYCESEDNTRLIPREHFYYLDVEQTFTLKFTAKENITYVGILFFQKDIDYQLKLLNFQIQETNSLNKNDSNPNKILGPIYKHLLPDPSELASLIDLPLDSNNNSHKRQQLSTRDNEIREYKFPEYSDLTRKQLIPIDWKESLTLENKLHYIINKGKKIFSTTNANVNANDIISKDDEIIVTMTTSPDNIDQLQKTINSLLDQTLPISHIYLNIPYNFNRNQGHPIPDWLFNNLKITINRCPDYLSLTPIFGYLPISGDIKNNVNINFNPQTKIIVVSDNIIYHKDFVKNLIKHFNNNNKNKPNNICNNTIISAKPCSWTLSSNSIINNTNTKKIDSHFKNVNQKHFISQSNGFLFTRNMMTEDINQLIPIIQRIIGTNNYDDNSSQSSDNNNNNEYIEIDKDINIGERINLLDFIITIYFYMKGYEVKFLENGNKSMENSKIGYENFTKHCHDILNSFHQILENIENEISNGTSNEMQKESNKAEDTESEFHNGFFAKQDTLSNDNESMIGSKVAVIVEPRKDNLLIDVVEHFREVLDDSWTIQIFHGLANKGMILNSRLKGWINAGKIKLTQLNVYNLSRMRYSRLLLSTEFYQKIKEDHILIFQTDTCFCKKPELTLEDFLEYDYVGAPWPRKKPMKSVTDPKRKVWVGNGGISLRKRSTMLKVCQVLSTPNNNLKHLLRQNEDLVISSILTDKKYFQDAKVPIFEQALKFGMEMVYSPNAIVIHKPWKYLRGKDLAQVKAVCPDMVRLFKGKHFA